MSPILHAKEHQVGGSEPPLHDFAEGFNDACRLDELGSTVNPCDEDGGLVGEYWWASKRTLLAAT